MTDKNHWVPVGEWRWRGFRRWHRWRVGPLCLSVYAYRPGEGLRPFFHHSWRYVNGDGEGRHVPSFRRWAHARRKYGR